MAEVLMENENMDEASTQGYSKFLHFKLKYQTD